MSTPPAHRRLVPRRPGQSQGQGQGQGKDPEDLEVTIKRRIFDPSVLDLEDDAAPAPQDSMSELTMERPLYEPEELDPTTLHQPAPAPTPAPADSFAEMVVERDEAIRASATLINPGALEDALHAAAAIDPDAQVPRMATEPAAGVSLVDLEPTRLRMAPTTSGIEDRPTAHLSPAEYGLLAAIAEGHEQSRIRYAEWLERRGESSRAELLRLDHALHAMSADDPRIIPTLQRIRAIAPRVSVDWRSRVSRAAIEGCSAYGVTCPKLWRALPAEADDARTCQACHEKVYYCATIQLAQDRVHKGQCVALDTACERWPRDLHRQCDSCSGQVSPQSRFCPHCGSAMPRAQSLG